MNSHSFFKFVCLAVLMALFGSFFRTEVVLLVGFILLCVWFLQDKHHFLVLGIVALLFGGYSNWRQENLKSQLGTLQEKNLQIKGRIIRFPEWYPNYTKTYIQVFSVNEEVLPQKEILLVQMPVVVAINYGDEVSFVGQIQKPKSFSAFDYQKYLERFRVFYIVSKPKNIEIINTKQGMWVLQKASTLRGWFIKRVKERVLYPYSALGVGVLVGVKEVFPKNIDDMIRTSGLQHIIVVSGFNVTVIVVLMMLLTKPFGPIIQWGVNILGILFFIALTGADPPVIRAGLMGIIAAFGLLKGQSADTKAILLLAAVIVGVWNPWLLVYDVGFQLSFLATAGIVLFGKWFQEKLSFIKWEFLREVLAISLVAQISVFPLLATTFDTVPMGGIGANLLVEPLVPLMMLWTFLVALLPDMMGILNIAASITNTIGSGIFWAARLFSYFPQVSLSQNFANILLFLQIIIFTFCFVRRA